MLSLAKLPKPVTRNSFEQRYINEILLPRMATGQYTWWAYEPWRFRLADRTTYTPDFAVVTRDRVIELHETKGSWKAKGAQVTRVKLKTCAEIYHMMKWYGITFRRGKWITEEF